MGELALKSRRAIRVAAAHTASLLLRGAKLAMKVVADGTMEHITPRERAVGTFFIALRIISIARCHIVAGKYVWHKILGRRRNEPRETIGGMDVFTDCSLRLRNLVVRPAGHERMGSVHRSEGHEGLQIVLFRPGSHQRDPQIGR
jgi:hypothetical protein